MNMIGPRLILTDREPIQLYMSYKCLREILVLAKGNSKSKKDLSVLKFDL